MPKAASDVSPTLDFEKFRRRSLFPGRSRPTDRWPDPPAGPPVGAAGRSGDRSGSRGWKSSRKSKCCSGRQNPDRGSLIHTISYYSTLLQTISTLFLIISFQVALFRAISHTIISQYFMPFDTVSHCFNFRRCVKPPHDCLANWMANHPVTHVRLDG